MDSMLTLAIPLSLVEEISDFLLLNPQWASGFSITDAQGMGHGAALVSAIEKVQGRSKRKLVLVVGEKSRLQELISALRAKIKNSNVAYWMTPVSDFGRF
jgi:primosomal protein N'